MNAVEKSVSKKDFMPPACAFPWQADLGDGTYRNPVLYADYSDPDVIRVGNDFYLAASSFNCTPGLPILHSKDLVNWTLINHAVKNLPHPRYAAVQPGCGIWAPALRFHDGKFWIFFPTPDEGIYVITAKNPAAKWSEPHLVQAGKGLIDPCPLWDDDGKAYLAHAYAGSRAGIKHRLRICPMAADGSRLLGEGQVVFHEPEKHPTIEGPKFLKKDGWYYIIAPAGGVETGWQTALRSKHIFGPYEIKIVLQQGRTAINGPHQGALVDAQNGEWWFMHFQDVGVCGRVTHLQPVSWRDGWPVMGSEGEPVLHSTKPVANQRPGSPEASDEFNSANLGLQWQWHANHRDDWYELGKRKGWVRLHPQVASRDELSLIPNLLLQKFPAQTFMVETSLELAARQIGEQAGLIIAGESSAALALEKTVSGTRLILQLDGAQVVIREHVPDAVRLRVAVQSDGLCTFSFAVVDGFSVVEQTFQARRGVWIGAKVGLYSLKTDDVAAAGHADFDYLRFMPMEASLR
ncbi:MAG TPA: glycoside hydrolase 43 family protein [Candidatus Angelobacter sp.]|nr:glycoside hydrolase 43 family protein [Candidatus Angelobacter sp.]